MEPSAYVDPVMGLIYLILFISLRGRFEPRATVLPEDKRTDTMTPSGIEPATFRFVQQCLK